MLGCNIKFCHNKLFDTVPFLFSSHQEIVFPRSEPHSSIHKLYHTCYYRWKETRNTLFQREQDVYFMKSNYAILHVFHRLQLSFVTVACRFLPISIFGFICNWKKCYLITRLGIYSEWRKLYDFNCWKNIWEIEFMYR